MAIYLGDLTIEQIEKRLGIELQEADKETLRLSHQGPVNDTPLEHGKWHCFDMPFMLMTHDVETASQFRDLFLRYDVSNFKETFQIAWES